MPPKKGIVRSGNAGNSSKTSKNVQPAQESQKPQKPLAPPLFPAGFKYPLNLLQERCQKNGWQTPEVITRKSGDGYSFVIILSRLVQKSAGQETETVRFEPHPPYICPSTIEARHWGATYALYRFCNGIQLERVLPPGPRDYWKALAAEHKAAPDHLKWQYEADPFAARTSVDERQAKAARKKEDVRSGKAVERKATKEFENEVEVKMSLELRDMVESTIQKELAKFPQAEGNTSLILAESQADDLLKQLLSLGFKQTQARKAIAYLSEPSPFATNLLQSASPLNACIEYLILNIPEVDLPPRFLPSYNSSNPFVTGLHGSADDIGKRWLEERAVKLGGFPAHIVRENTTEGLLATSFAHLIASLNRRLLGEDWRELLNENVTANPAGEVEDRISTEDIESMGAHWDEKDEHSLIMPLFSAPLQLNFVIPPHITYNRSSHPPPMYITSTEAPAYVRLHLLAQVLKAFKSGTILDNGFGILLGAMQIVDEQWALIEDQGPPDITSVMQHLMPQLPDDDDDREEVTETRQKSRRRVPAQRRDRRTDTQVKAEFEEVQNKGLYKDMLQTRGRLPAFKAKDEFLVMLEQSRVVVVVGETGSGKTTQLPQFVLDSLISSGKGSSANILITQPRRISAISVAARVSAERCMDGSVGYSIRGESNQVETTKLLFCTTGVVLRRLSVGDKLAGVTHIIVDEVHERSVDGDFLLLELKDLLVTHPTLKVVLMSATINHETFIRYFNGAPLLTISGYAHPVEDRYLEDYIADINYMPNAARSAGGRRKDDEENDFVDLGLNERHSSAIRVLDRQDKVDTGLASRVVSHIIETAEAKGGILVFMPGVQEIRDLVYQLNSLYRDNKAATVFPLHANLSNEEQRSVFRSVPGWKIVVATNVAETSITIDDIVYVVDGGRVKETQFEHETGLTRLVEIWVTRAAARQRRGRAGRTQPGICYKLYTRARERKMAAFPTPEIRRVPLESIALTVKATRENIDVKLFLNRAIDPPSVATMDKALSVLDELGAIDQAGKLTALGRLMSQLPVDLRLGKMLILATVFQCLDPILTIASFLSSKPLFLSPLDNREEAARQRKTFAQDRSDLLTDLAAYNECVRMREDSARAFNRFAENNFISKSTFNDVRTLRNELLAALTSIGLVPYDTSPTAPYLNTHSSTTLIKSIVFAALYPRVARVMLPRGALKFNQTAGGAVQRENTAKEYKVIDMRGERVWIHPASIVFGEAVWKSGLVASFQRVATSKVYLRDVTEVPLYALLLFGGKITVNHVGGGLTVGGREGMIRLKAWPRIGILVQQLRWLLDAQLMRVVDSSGALSLGKNNAVIRTMLALLESDGMSQREI
ncbi:P-loop containing nucleoside triphosphate hydrolase protein [Vararia minispora EC-137]|uniref:P-loop containing nucleoside triphosphate hydrolase protein n=1 Tax=Vararia minispora EC-137 TaxID=1314806 RepID=A0ACB8QKM7_9AGAM|nr:P-loop containing nucleoside triphosphate hydrolase protein [Vararia minispora EC-137]